MSKPVIIFGTGGLARTALNIFEQNEVLVYGFLTEDETEVGEEINRIMVMATVDDDVFIRKSTKEADVFVALEDQSEREEMIHTLIKKHKKMPTNAIHRSAQLANDLSMGYGNLIQAGVSIGAAVELGNHNVIGSGTQIDYQVKLEDFVRLGAGCVVSAKVHLASQVLVGSGAVISGGVKVGKNAKIAAGSVVLRNVKEEAAVFGNPAQEV